MRAAGGPQPVLTYGFGKRALHQVADGLRMHLAAKLLPHDGKRHLAGPESFQTRSACQTLEPLIDLAGDPLARHRHFEPPFQPVSRRHRCLHLAAFHRSLFIAKP